MVKFYLAHPFDTRERMKIWEQRVEKQYDIEIINPFYDIHRSDIIEVDAGREDRYKILNPSNVVTKDVDAIKDSTGIIALIDGSLSYGTIMEIWIAHSLGKEVYLIITNGHEGHPWLRYCATNVFTSLDDFENTILKREN